MIQKTNQTTLNQMVSKYQTTLVLIYTIQSRTYVEQRSFIVRFDLKEKCFDPQKSVLLFQPRNRTEFTGVDFH